MKTQTIWMKTLARNRVTWLSRSDSSLQLDPTSRRVHADDDGYYARAGVPSSSLCGSRCCNCSGLCSRVDGDDDGLPSLAVVSVSSGWPSSCPCSACSGTKRGWLAVTGPSSPPAAPSWERRVGDWLRSRCAMCAAVSRSIRSALASVCRLIQRRHPRRRPIHRRLPFRVRLYY